MLGGDVLHHVLARVATIVVRRASQLVLHAGVEQNELVALGVEGEVFEFTRAAVEAHQLAFLTEHRSELVHDTAVHTAVVVLRSLAGEHHVPLRNLVVTEEVVQTASEAALHSSR